jgi:hypothetical protein
LTTPGGNPDPHEGKAAVLGEHDPVVPDGGLSGRDVAGQRLPTVTVR